MNRDAEIFIEALDLPPTERAAFLDRACGDDAALRARVEKLLLGHRLAGTFMEKPPVERPGEIADELPGSVIGRYTVVRKIGEGGCGVVYLAEQNEPVRRQVALKVIKLGMDTRQVIARFEAERQALALMDHPDIARVFDAGATDNGRPFFVMEFVDGVPITKFCDENSLNMATRLELFARVCVALQHAHQKGIVHRDLKPSNILVSLRDGAPAPKVIDFGIAKATQGRLTEQTLVTGFDQFIGTPAYMSPEQAELRDLDIDTRSDVYSLGVLLYELLTGRPPYDPQSLVRAGVEEIRRIIREVDPPRPSTRVSTLGDADLATVARLRRAAPTRLTSALRGDLDWIVMRCLEKDRARRYDTAVALAEDVRRHLRQEPVTARPPATLYRLQKFVARNRLACASAAAVALALIVGTIVSTREAIRANRAERAAERARTEAVRQREQAESLITFMLGDYRADVKKLGKLDLLDAVNDRALAYFAAFDLNTLSDVALTQQAKALYQIGETRIDQARYADAATAFTNSYQRSAALVARHPQNADMLFERAQAEYWIGFVARRQGDLTKAREWLVRYRDSGAALVAIEGPKVRAQREQIAGQHNLAVLDFDRGALTEAHAEFLAERAAMTAMVAANPNDSALRYRLADIASWLGRVAESEGRYTEAIDYGREMTRRLEELIALEPNVVQWQVRLADSRVFTAFPLALIRRQTEAAALLEEAITAFLKLLEKDPSNQQWRSLLLNLQLQRTTMLLANGDLTTAGPLLDDTRAKLENLHSLEPSSRAIRSRLGAAWLLEARVRHRANRDDALMAAERSIALTQPLIDDGRADALAFWEFAQARILAGRIEASRDRPDAALQHWEAVIAALRTPAATSNHWRYLDPLAQALVLTGQATQALPLIQRLQQFGYRPIDPLAVPILSTAP